MPTIFTYFNRIYFELFVPTPAPKCTRLLVSKKITKKKINFDTTISDVLTYQCYVHNRPNTQSYSFYEHPIGWRLFSVFSFWHKVTDEGCTVNTIKIGQNHVDVTVIIRYKTNELFFFFTRVKSAGLFIIRCDCVTSTLVLCIWLVTFAMSLYKAYTMS